MTTADALLRTLKSPNVPDSNLEHANVVDVLAHLAYSTRKVAEAISPTAAPGTDATGGSISSLGEAVMGATAGLCRIADSISDLAAAVREHTTENKESQS